MCVVHMEEKQLILMPSDQTKSNNFINHGDGSDGGNRSGVVHNSNDKGSSHGLALVIMIVIEAVYNNWLTVTLDGLCHLTFNVNKAQI